MSTETTTPAQEAAHLQAERKLGGVERLSTFLQDTRAEMHKVVTPDRTVVRSTTIIVIVTVFLFAAYFELVDLTLGRGIDKILLHLTKH